MGKVTNFEYGNFDIEKFNFENGNFEFEFNSFEVPVFKITYLYQINELNNYTNYSNDNNTYFGSFNYRRLAMLMFLKSTTTTTARTTAMTTTTTALTLVCVIVDGWRSGLKRRVLRFPSFCSVQLTLRSNFVNRWRFFVATVVMKTIVS